ncbi:WD repeat and HMG-box DNA-binding protein 1 [Phlebotomus argentipes]|uniref:WD repeat and HMG-box DNA-binding protein 1 n=1 Tax=Phlebotomus argentipes TaxID=94469 RepID=UPI0028930C35|nr:WD repeat and HMG-box DNA-binding protein 1 [Phlebotomus argentipes]
MKFERSLTRYGHGSGYTSVCYEMGTDTIISSGGDGDIHIWKGVEDDDPMTGCAGEFISCLAFYDDHIFVGTELNIVQILTNRDFDRDGTQFRFTAPATAMRVTDKYVAAGSEDTTIKVTIREGAEEVELTGHSGPILALDVSPEGFLASSSGDGSLKIWKIADQSVVKTIEGFPLVKTVSLAEGFVTPSFYPKFGKYLAYPKDKEIIVLESTNWTLKHTLKNDKISGKFSVCAFSPCGKFICAGSTTGEISVWEFNTLQSLRGPTKGDESDMITSIDWCSSSGDQIVFADKAGQIACITLKDEEGKRLADVAEDRENFLEMEAFGESDSESEDSEEEDNENCISLKRIKKATMRPLDDVEAEEVKSDIVERKPEINLSQLQKAFQPGATPDHLEHRYMAWNSVGIVKAHKTDVENSIEVEFHDVTVHHAIHMNNFLGHSLAGVSERVLALSGCSPCKVVGIALGAGSREWSVSLPNCEEALALTASNNLVAVATDERLLRIFTTLGTQREVISIPGKPVTLASHGNHLMVVYHTTSTALDADQHLSAILINALGLQLRSRDVRLSISPKSRLTWLGFTDAGSPASFDSAGMLRIFSKSANLWYPVCDLKEHTKGASDTFYIVEVSEEKQLVRTILCRGLSYPLTSPRPVVMEIPLQMPLCEIEAEKSTWEDALVRQAAFAVENREKLMRETAIKLFALACRNEMEARASDLIEMIGCPQLVPLAAKYANKLGRIHLAEKLGQMLPQIQELEREREKENRSSSPDIGETQDILSLPQPLVVRTPDPSVVVAPKPMLKSSVKRNPFRKANMSSPLTPSADPLSHLTEKIVGFTPKPNIQSPQSDTAPKTFMAWFTENHDELATEMPEEHTPAQLTSFAMKRYKGLIQGVPAAKRRLEDEDKTTAKKVC